MQQLVARRHGQGFRRYTRAVLAAAKFIGAREMVERPAALTDREPQEAERAVGFVVLRLKRADTAESLDRFRTCPSAISATARL